MFITVLLQQSSVCIWVNLFDVSFVLTLDVDELISLKLQTDLQLCKLFIIYF